MLPTAFTDVGPALTEADIREAERQTGVRFPPPIVAHYLERNGGTPEASLFDNGELEASVSHFLPIRYPRPDGRTLESTHRRMVEQEVLDPELVLFAVDWGSNFFCFDEAGRIYYCTTDSWREGLSHAENRARSRRQIASALYDFIEGLESEE
jgi:hypothetical protein